SRFRTPVASVSEGLSGKTSNSGCPMTSSLSYARRARRRKSPAHRRSRLPWIDQIDSAVLEISNIAGSQDGYVRRRDRRNLRIEVRDRAACSTASCRDRRIWKGCVSIERKHPAGKVLFE